MSSKWYESFPIGTNVGGKTKANKSEFIFPR